MSSVRREAFLPSRAIAAPEETARAPMSSERFWAIAFVLPYMVVFALFVVYPVYYGLRVGLNPVGYNKQPWIDSHGTFYTDALRVVERWKFVDANTIDYEATIEDAKVFTQPWKIAYQIQRLREKNFELIEEACWEGVSVSNRLEAGRIAAKSGTQRIHSHSEP